MRKALLGFALAGALGIGAVLLAFAAPAPQPSTLQLNNALAAAQAGTQTQAAKLLQAGIEDAFREMNAAHTARDTALQGFLCAFILLFLAAGAAFYAYCARSVLRPFRKLRQFAQNVAAGQLDVPLEMDRHGRFGAFTESFDLMREELARARENERAANTGKKELLASLSHDIKTPTASIRAVAELMQAKGEGEAARLDIIVAKADQIDLLVSNLFQATLEELTQLKVKPTDVPSTVLPHLLQNADYEKRAAIGAIPGCIVRMDEVRLQQVFDNIISNAYKYGGKHIRVLAAFEGAYLALTIKDNGPGVSEDDMPLLFTKFYRGGNAEGKSGSGLGLYISRHLMREMGGDVLCRQDEEGFAIKVLLAL